MKSFTTTFVSWCIKAKLSVNFQSVSFIFLALRISLQETCKRIISIHNLCNHSAVASLAENHYLTWKKFLCSSAIKKCKIKHIVDVHRSWVIQHSCASFILAAYLFHNISIKISSGFKKVFVFCYTLHSFLCFYAHTALLLNPTTVFDRLLLWQFYIWICSKSSYCCSGCRFIVVDQTPY